MRLSRLHFGKRMQRYRRSAAILNQKYSLYMIPALLSAVGVSLSEFADSLIVGRLLSEDAFAIVNLGTPIVFMASMVYTITGLGGSLLYAEYLAKKEKARAAGPPPRRRESSEDLYGDLPAYGSQKQQPASNAKIGSATYSRYSGKKQEDVTPEPEPETDPAAD